MKKIQKMLKKINVIKILIIELYLVLAQLVWHLKDYVIDYMISVEPTELAKNMIYYVCNIALAVVLTIILIALIIKLKKHKKEIKNEEKNMKDIDLKNNNDEYVKCNKILDGNEENQKIYELDSKNISLEKMKKRQDYLEAVYDIKIDYMEYGKTTETINVYCTPRKFLKPTLFDVWAEDHFLDDFLSALVVGSTGSGKTYFTHQLLGKVVYNKEFIKDEDVKVFICDRKNEDYIQFKNCPNYYGINAVDGIKKVHEIFTERLNNEESNDNKETIICLIEEYALLLNSLDKKEAEDVKNMVADLLFAGRSKKIVTIVSLQRADAIYFPRGAKEQFKKIIMMGNLSKIQLDMLLDEDMQKQVTEINPQGYGYLYEDGKRKLTHIKVAEITQEDMTRLDRIIGEKMV